MRTILESAGILVATTIGAGVFALPFVFREAGWVTGLLYLLFFGLVVAWVHALYLKTLAVVKGEKHILALVREEGTKRFFFFSVIVLVGGLVLSLVVYLLLGAQFLQLLFPVLRPWVAILIFWIFGTVPLVVAVHRVGSLEFFGMCSLIGIMFLLFLLGVHGIGDIFKNPVFVPASALLPLGAVLFSLAGWTALEPMYEAQRKSSSLPKSLVLSLWLGTAIVVVSYLLFVGGIMGSGAPLTPDTLSGFVVVAPKVAQFLALFGLLALLTSYVPVGLEVKNLLGVDMEWRYAFPFVAIVPPLLIVLGIDTFVEAIGIAGGVFVAFQYVLILFVAQRKLFLSPSARFFARGISVLFFLVAAYEVFEFFI